jgi:hypothetical protein
MKSSIKTFFIVVFLVFVQLPSFSWGFFSHKLINKYAVFLLPPEMIGFYKKHIDYLIAHSVDPDKRSHTVEGEAQKHYIDIDVYGDNPFEVVPKRWKDAVAKYSEDTLQKYGIVPWWIEKMFYQLVHAFKEKDVDKIFWISANLGHYIADANVPLHTTQFYDGKKPYQKGVHALWESRLPELFAKDYDYFIGRAQYIPNPLEAAWKMVERSHRQMDTVLNVFDSLFLHYNPNQIYIVEERNGAIKKQFSKEFCETYDRFLHQMVYRNLRNSMLMVASFWYSAWVMAGQPNLDELLDKDISQAMQKEQEELEYLWKHGKPKGRPNPEESEE